MQRTAVKQNLNPAFMKEREVLPLVLSMALPMVFSMLVNALYNIVDSAFVGRISENALTALSLVFPLQNFISAAAIGFGVGINAVISFYLGAGKQKKADQAASFGLLAASVHGVILTIICLGCLSGFLKMYTNDPETYRCGMAYGRIVFGFAVITNVSIGYEKVFQAVGRMKSAMAAMTLGCLTNIFLDPCMIFGYGPFAEMGIAGAATATVIGQAVTLGYYLLAAVLRPLSVHVGLRDMKPERRLAARIYSVGVPAVLNLALPSLMISALNAILASFGQVYVLILGIYYKLQTFLYLPANGFIQGMRPLVGYNSGAGEYARVKKIICTVLAMCLLIMGIGTLLCMAVPEAFMGIFTHHPETVRSGAAALRIISLGFLVSAVSITVCGALEGLSRGVPSLWISLCRYLVIILPVSFVLSRILGAEGVWHAFWISEMMSAGLSFAVYKKYIVQKTV